MPTMPPLSAAPEHAPPRRTGQQQDGGRRRWLHRVTEAEIFSKDTSLNLSHFVARQIWRRRGVSPLHCRAHRLQRREPFRGLLLRMDTILDLLQTV